MNHTHTFNTVIPKRDDWDLILQTHVRMTVYTDGICSQDVNLEVSIILGKYSNTLRYFRLKFSLL